MGRKAGQEYKATFASTGAAIGIGNVLRLQWMCVLGSFTSKHLKES